MEFYVHLGKRASKYAKDEETNYEASVVRLFDAIHVSFFFQGERHHTGTMKVSPEVARWLAYALLSATDGGKDAQPVSMRVVEDSIVERKVER